MHNILAVPESGVCANSTAAQRRVPLDKDEGIVKHKNPGRYVSAACLASGFEDQISGRFTLHHLWWAFWRLPTHLRRCLIAPKVGHL
jgi:hypothetical protein